MQFEQYRFGLAKTEFHTHNPQRPEVSVTDHETTNYYHYFVCSNRFLFPTWRTRRTPVHMTDLMIE